MHPAGIHEIDDHYSRTIIGTRTPQERSSRALCPSPPFERPSQELICEFASDRHGSPSTSKQPLSTFKMISSAKTLALATAVMATTADAHSKMILPKPTWDPSWGTNSPSGTIDGPNVLTVPTGMSFSTDPASNTKAYTAAFKAQTKYGSLEDLVVATQTLKSGASQECGFSLANGAAQPLPDVVEWDELTVSHQGPCEVWCDDVLAFSDENCATNYPGNPAKLPYDESKCTGASMLTSIWLALHVATWQVYLNCAPLSGATATSSGSSASSAATTAVASASSASSTSSTSSYSSDDEYATPTPSPASDSEASDASTTTAASYSDGSSEATSTASSEASAGESPSATSASTSTSSTASSTASVSSSSTPTPASTTTSKCKAKTTRRRQRN